MKALHTSLHRLRGGDIAKSYKNYCGSLESNRRGEKEQSIRNNQSNKTKDLNQNDNRLKENVPCVSKWKKNYDCKWRSWTEQNSYVNNFMKLERQFARG